MKLVRVALLLVTSFFLSLSVFVSGSSVASASPAEVPGRLAMVETPRARCAQESATALEGAPDRVLTPEESVKLAEAERQLKELSAMTPEQLDELVIRAKIASEHPHIALAMPGPVAIINCVLTIGLTFWSGVNSSNIIPAIAGIILGCLGLPAILGAGKLLGKAIWSHRHAIAEALKRIGAPHAAGVLIRAPKP